ncbi:hypothetical protein BKA69DRAFT_1121865 [Paraphysoderma sedebokerense]|nr:hypothetical protein BKA69DRAFT_1121865 [Paraphysoderma sedebokerense]
MPSPLVVAGILAGTVVAGLAVYRILDEFDSFESHRSYAPSHSRSQPTNSLKHESDDEDEEFHDPSSTILSHSTSHALHHNINSSIRNRHKPLEASDISILDSEIQAADIELQEILQRKEKLELLRNQALVSEVEKEILVKDESTKVQQPSTSGSAPVDVSPSNSSSCPPLPPRPPVQSADMESRQLSPDALLDIPISQTELESGNRPNAFVEPELDSKSLHSIQLDVDNGELKTETDPVRETAHNLQSNNVDADMKNDALSNFDVQSISTILSNVDQLSEATTGFDVVDDFDGHDVTSNEHP